MSAVVLRVVHVRLGSGGSTQILGREENTGRYYFFVAPTILRLGQLVEVEPETRWDQRGLCVLEGGRVTAVGERYARRCVPEIWKRRILDVNRGCRSLYAYQVEGAAWLAWRLAGKRSSILADEPGVAKTAQVVTALVAARALPAVIVPPSSVKTHWQREIEKCVRHPLSVQIVRGTTSALRPAHFYVVNYDILVARHEELLRMGLRGVVYDEATRIKCETPSPEHRATIATRLAHRIRRAVLVTGTPIENRPTELWRLLHIADPYRWPSLSEFREQHCRRPAEGEDGGRMLITDRGIVTHLDELQAATDPYILRRRFVDVRPDLPPKERRSVIVDLDPESLQTYRAAERDVAAWLRSIGKNEQARRAAHSQALVRFTALRRLAAMGKLAHAVPLYLRRWWRATEKVRPLVVTGYHEIVLDGIESTLRSAGVRYVRLRGSDPDSKRQQAVDAFQRGDADAFVLPILAGGQGVNLSRASNMLAVERVFSPAQMEQMEDRCRRLTSVDPLTVVYLDAANTIDEHIADILADKAELITGIVDGEVERRGRGMVEKLIERLVA